ncbi:hypothetical protein ACHQM5_008753 [Ranunculus cassubicifolius]
MDVGAPTISISTPTAADGWRWNSPLPYLYGGLAAVLIAIALSLLSLAYSHWKSSDRNSSEVDVENQVKQSLPPRVELEPKLAVIMAGNHEPTYLAYPVSSYTSRMQEQQ